MTDTVNSVNKTNDIRETTMKILSLTETHKWVERSIGDLSKETYKSIDPVKYMIAQKDDQLWLFDNKFNIIGQGKHNPKGHSIHSQEKPHADDMNKGLLASYTMNYFAGGVVSLYSNGTFIWTQYGSGRPFIFSCKGSFKEAAEYTEKVKNILQKQQSQLSYV